MTVTRISRHGNGYAVHLPRKLLMLLGWTAGEHLELVPVANTADESKWGHLQIWKLLPRGKEAKMTNGLDK